MNNILNKPYTRKNYADFAVMANKNEMRIEITSDAAYALKEYEMLENENIVDFRVTQQYQNKKRLEEITIELNQADKDYEDILATPIEYTNGFLYKPKYVQDSYALLIAADIFPLIIWDSSETNYIEMTKTDLLQLSMFLKNIVEPAFQQRKNKRKILLEEKAAVEQVV